MTIGPGSEVGGRYELGHQLGSGGMATVYVAYDSLLDREVAVKVLAQRFAADPAFVERFRREASAAAGLNHPNIVAVYDRGEAEDTYYIVMEYLSGPDLKKVIRDQGPLPAPAAVDNALQILSALTAAHAAGIVHRDIKPQNVMVGEDGRLRVADFGIARAGADEQMTEVGSVIGTAQYLSPEQAQGEETTAASDTYSVGIVLYEMLTGRVPFDGDRPVTVAMKQINEPPIPPRVFEPGIPAELDAVVIKALAKRPDDRYATADDFTAALLDVRAEMSGGQQSTLILTAPTAVTAAAADATMETRAMRSNGGDSRGGGTRGRKPAARNRGGNNRPAVWGIVAVLIAALAVALALSLTRGGSDTIAVPEVAGFDVPGATRTLQDAGLKPTQITQASETVATGIVIGTRPGSGTDVAKDSAVVILVSSGPAVVTVPSVVGKSLAEAQALLERGGFTVTTESVESGKDVGTVVKQSPTAGSQAGSGDTVVLSVSKGVTKVSVPDVTDDDISTARSALASAGLTVGNVSEDDGTSGRSPGTVLSQDPSAGSSVAKGSAVNLAVAAQSSGVDVPDVTGTDAATARAKLESLGFNVVSSGAASTQPEGTVIDQDPTPGTTIDAGSTVTIIVAFPSTTTSSGGGTTTSSGTAQPPATTHGGAAGGGGSQPPPPR